MRTYSAAREGRGVFVGAVDVLSIRMPPISRRIENPLCCSAPQGLHLISAKLRSFRDKLGKKNNLPEIWWGNLKSISAARSWPKTGAIFDFDPTIEDSGKTGR
jgi:hypothetical protein